METDDGAVWQLPVFDCAVRVENGVASFFGVEKIHSRALENQIVRYLTAKRILRFLESLEHPLNQSLTQNLMEKHKQFSI